MRIIWAWVLVCAASCPIVSGNTEIVNFSVSPEEGVPISQTALWPTLSRDHNHDRYILPAAPLYSTLRDVCEPPSPGQPCPHELWLVLDTTDDAWTRHEKFTLRLSWPAHFPADFLIEVFDPKAVSIKLPPTTSSTSPKVTHSGITSLKYARVRLVDTGVLTPPSTTPPEPVPFTLILEPLYFGFLPESVVPIFLFLVPVVCIAGMGVPRVMRYLDAIASKAVEERQKSEKVE